MPRLTPAMMLTPALSPAMAARGLTVETAALPIFAVEQEWTPDQDWIIPSGPARGRGMKPFAATERLQPWVIDNRCILYNKDGHNDSHFSGRGHAVSLEKHLGPIEAIATADLDPAFCGRVFSKEVWADFQQRLSRAISVRTGIAVPAATAPAASTPAATAPAADPAAVAKAAAAAAHHQFHQELRHHQQQQQAAQQQTSEQRELQAADAAQQQIPQQHGLQAAGSSAADASAADGAEHPGKRLRGPDPEPPTCDDDVVALQKTVANQAILIMSLAKSIDFLYICCVHHFGPGSAWAAEGEASPAPAEPAPAEGGEASPAPAEAEAALTAAQAAEVAEGGAAFTAQQAAAFVGLLNRLPPPPPKPSADMASEAEKETSIAYSSCATKSRAPTCPQTRKAVGLVRLRSLTAPVRIRPPSSAGSDVITTPPKPPSPPRSASAASQASIHLPSISSVQATHVQPPPTPRRRAFCPPADIWVWP